MPEEPKAGVEKRLKREYLDKKFSFSFTREECFELRMLIVRFYAQLGLADIKSLLGVLEKLEAVGLKPAEQDYEPEGTPEKSPEPQVN